MMQPTTLRGIFPDRPVVHRRNFIRENVKRIRQMQGEPHGAHPHDLRAKSDSNARFGTKSHLSTSLSKLKLDESVAATGTPKTSVYQKNQLRRPGIQKLEIRPAEKRAQHISDLVVVNNISHRSMQTEVGDDLAQIYATGVIKFPTKELFSQRKRQGRRRDTGHGDTPEVCLNANVNNNNNSLAKATGPNPVDTIEGNASPTANMNACAESGPGSPPLRTDFIKNNMLALKMRAKQKPTANANTCEGGKVPAHYKKGVTPKYIKKKEPPEEVVVDADCPPGHVLLPEEERKETLRVLRESYAEKIQEMNSMPVRSDTLKMQKRKMDLEIELKKIDEGIKVFQRPKVYVKVNV